MANVDEIDEILKQLTGSWLTGTHQPMPAGGAGRNSHYSEQEMIKMFLAGWQVQNLTDEKPSEEIINMAKEFLKKTRNGY